MVKRKIYWVKDDGINCPVCGSKLGGCHIGAYCPSEKCTWFDGTAKLTEKQAKKLKDKILPFIQPVWKL